MANAITNVIIIMSMYNVEGIILCFFFIAFRCPFGVDKKQLAAMFNTWQNENMTANVLTSNPENTNTNVKINDIKKPVIEHAKNPITLCFHVRPPHNVYSFLLPGKVNTLSLGCSAPN